MDKDKIELYAGEIKRIMDEALEIVNDNTESANTRMYAKIHAFDDLMELLR